MSEKTRVLITGATGFAGEHLIRALKEDVDSAYDIYGTTFPASPATAAGRLFYLDLRAENDICSLVKDVRPDWIFHLAAISSVHTSWQKRSETLQTNVLGTQNLLEAVRKSRPGARLLFVSSSDVYGAAEPPAEGFSETGPIQVTSPYAFSKAAGEMLCGFYERFENIDLVIARPFPHTGPGQSEDFVCSDWARQIVRMERGEIAPNLKVGNLNILRDFCDVRDVVRAYILLLQKGRRGEVYNICSAKAVPLQNVLALLIGGALDSSAISIDIDPAKLRRTDMPLLVGSNRKISGEVGWSPRISLERTLRDLLSFWRQTRT